MFKNAERDPLAVPALIQRRSVGPTHRQAAFDPNNPEDIAAEEELHRRHQERGGEGNPDPRDFYKTTSVPPKVARTIDFQAREFLAQDHGCDDRSELLYQAERHARTQTSTWTPEASQKATQAFVAKVAELVPNRPSRVAAAQSPVFEDFDDQLLY